MFKSTLRKLAYSILILGFISLIFAYNKQAIPLDLYLFQVQIGLNLVLVFAFILGIIISMLWYSNSKPLSKEDETFIGPSDKYSDIDRENQDYINPNL